MTLSSCGLNNENHSNTNGRNSGGYHASLVFPDDIPRMDSVANALRNIDCDKYGIAVIRFAFFDGADSQLVEDQFSCSAHHAVVGGIPAGNDRRVVVTAEGQSGEILLRGEERNIIIKENQDTKGGDIAMQPPNSPTVIVGETPKTLIFNWEHMDFPATTDHFRLEVSPDGDSDFITIEGADRITTAEFTLTVAVHLSDWVNTVYRVVALDTADNVVAVSSNVNLAAITAEGLIGYLKADNTDPGDRFGNSIALSADGNTLAVGAWNEDGGSDWLYPEPADNSAANAGAVYVFARTNDGIWRQQAYIKADTPDAYDIFGASVALSSDGNTLAIGVTSEDGLNSAYENDASNAGAVYVFTQNVSGRWERQGYLKSSNIDSDDSFGSSVAFSSDGNILAVGATGEAGGDPANSNDNSASSAGAVYVFTRDAAGEWGEQSYIKASNPDSNDFFGSGSFGGGGIALSADGNTMAVGAWGEDSGNPSDPNDNSSDGSGAVYIFTRSSAGAWNQQVYIKADDSDTFGWKVALSSDGNTLAVAAWSEDNSRPMEPNDHNASNSGAVYLFSQMGAGVWRQQAYLKASNIGDSDEFGRSLALSSDGNTLAVGATGEASLSSTDQEDNSGEEVGAVYVFSRQSGDSWIQRAYIKASTPGLLDNFGWSVALSSNGETLAVGALNEASGSPNDPNDNSTSEAGAAYLY
jgi:hypothetical protein